MGHAIGFQHEQTRPDRDTYVYINTGNIQNGVAYNFMRYTQNQVNNYNVPYDYTSVMHYSAYVSAEVLLFTRCAQIKLSSLSEYLRIEKNRLQFSCGCYLPAVAM